MTAELVGQFRERGAEVVELPHAGGHQIDAAAAAADRLDHHPPGAAHSLTSG